MLWLFSKCSLLFPTPAAWITSNCSLAIQLSSFLVGGSARLVSPHCYVLFWECGQSSAIPLLLTAVTMDSMLVLISSSSLLIKQHIHDFKTNTTAWKSHSTAFAMWPLMQVYFSWKCDGSYQLQITHGKKHFSLIALLRINLFSYNVLNTPTS